MASLCLNCRGEVRVRKTGYWPQPVRYPNLGVWLCRVRHQCGGAKYKFARLADVSVGTLDNWTRNRTRPGVLRLRWLRDRLEMPTELIEKVLRRFYVGEPVCEVESPADVAVFWKLIHSRRESSMKQRCRDRIIVRYKDLARRAALRFRRLGEVDDLVQDALLGLTGAAMRYVPTLGSFDRFGSVTCHYSVLRHLSARYYESVPMHLRRAFTAVRRVVNRLSQVTGREPGEDVIRAETGLPTYVVREALAFLSQRRVSLERRFGRDGRSLADVLGATPSAFEDTELAVDVERSLAHLPGAAALVTDHVIGGVPLATVANRANLALDESRRLLADSLRVLRPVLAGGAL